MQAAATVATLMVHPAAVSLETSSDSQRFVVLAEMSDGTTEDVTEKAEYAFDKDTFAKIEKLSLLPIADGETVLHAAFGGKTADMQIKVTGAAQPRKISFRLDVMPVLMRAGCNSGTCHGAASGKNGFRMSLFGFDPNEDYLRLTRETTGRRLDVADVKASLMLTKATAVVAHEGGKRVEPGDEYYNTIEKWISEGANNDPADVATLTGIDIMPKRTVLNGEGAQQRYVVRATYSDGTDRDVTSTAVLSSNNDNSAVIDNEAVLTAKNRGEAFVMARFGTYAVVSQVIVLPKDLEFAWPNVPETNYIDTLINNKLKKLRIIPSEVASDEIFLRRVYLDIVGVLPTVAEYEEFMADSSENKRAKLIDALLIRPEFPELWAMKWAELLRIESASQRLSYKAMYQYTDWLRNQILSDVPMDQMAKALLSSSGGNMTNPSTNFYMVEQDPKLVAENVAQVFFGIRIQCAQCHNHPFERWTMDDYYSFSAFFPQIGRKGGEDPRETIVFNSGGGEVGHIRDGRVMAPKFLGGAAPDVAGKDRRVVLAEWLTGPDNPWFATSFADRAWQHFFGKGIVDPPDDVRVSNPPSNPELYDTLGKKFVEYKYDLRKLIRDICNSRTYQLSTRTNETNAEDDKNFSHGAIRRLPAEQLLDGICQVTESATKFSRLPLGARATQVADGRTGNYFLDVFGRPARTSACTCDRRSDPTLGQALHLINGDTITGKINDKNGRMHRLLAANSPFEKMVEDLYVAAMTRKPTEKEMQTAQAHLKTTGDPKVAVEDLYWAVLNSQEFVFNH